MPETFKDESDKTAIKIFLILVVLATIAWRVSKIYEDCAEGCESAGQRFDRLEIKSIVSGVCVCVDK